MNWRKWSPFRWLGGEEFPMLRGCGFGFTTEPTVDVFESDGEIVVTAELPGVEKKDIKLRVTEEGLSLRVERRERKEKEKKEPGFYAYSYAARFGGYSEWILFPSPVEAGRAKAVFKNGILEVRVPKLGTLNKGREVKID